MPRLQHRCEALQDLFHLKSSIPGDPTATDLEMMPFFRVYSCFVRDHANLFNFVAQSSDQPTSDETNLALNLLHHPSTGRLLLHVIIHDYDGNIHHRDSL